MIQAVRRAVTAGMVVVMSAGNDGNNARIWIVDLGKWQVAGHFMCPDGVVGVVYSPLSRAWSLHKRDLDVNYMLYGSKGVG